MDNGAMFKNPVTSERELRDLLGYPGERAILKQTDTLDEHHRAFITLSPFMLLATANAAGAMSPRRETRPDSFSRWTTIIWRFPIVRETAGSTACATSSRTPTSA
jgi:hypothetical protein